MMQLLVIIHVYVKVTSGTSIFFLYLEEAVFNTFAIYKNYHPQPKYTFMEFKLEIIHSMLGNAGSHVEPSSEFDRLKGCHFAKVEPEVEKKGKPQKRYIICWKRKVRKRIAIYQ